MKNPDDITRIKCVIEDIDIGALVVIDGDGTLRAAQEVSTHGKPIRGIPKTINNDVFGTNATIGFDTAVFIVTEAIDRLHTTAESHHRIMVVEVMGRRSGWIALAAGIAGGADEIPVPEMRTSLGEVCLSLDERYRAGKNFSIVVVAEGTRREDIAGISVPECDRDECGHEKFVGVGTVLSKELERRLGVETRVTVLGHVQRGGNPISYDRVLATCLGIETVHQIHAGNFGCIAAVQGNRIVNVPPLNQSCIGQRESIPMNIYAQNRWPGSTHKYRFC